MIKETFGRQCHLEPFQPGQQLTETDVSDVDCCKGEGAPRGVEGGLGVDDDSVALGDRRERRVQDPALAGDGDRQVGRGVAQREKCGVRAGSAGELRHLPLDPDAAQPVDPARDQLAHRAYGSRFLWGGLEGHVAERTGGRPQRGRFGPE